MTKKADMDEKIKAFREKQWDEMVDQRNQEPEEEEKPPLKLTRLDRIEAATPAPPAIVAPAPAPPAIAAPAAAASAVEAAEAPEAIAGASAAFPELAIPAVTIGGGIALGEAARSPQGSISEYLPGGGGGGGGHDYAGQAFSQAILSALNKAGGIASRMG
jgi:hypothetical protein